MGDTVARVDNSAGQGTAHRLVTNQVHPHTVTRFSQTKSTPVTGAIGTVASHASIAKNAQHSIRC